MRKLFTFIIVLGLAGFMNTAAAVDGDFEMGGHVNTGLGFQYYGKNASSGITQASGNSYGGLGDLGSNNGKLARQQTLIGFVDEGEINLMKSFGENVRSRLDVAFALAASGSPAAAGGLEQAYATVNIPVGNGIEFLVGRFDTPIGFESVERGENSLFSNTVLLNSGLRPTQGTGLKFYYPFSDLVDVHWYLVNNLRDALALDNTWPATGFRLGFGWGDEGRRSTVGVSAAAGSDGLEGTVAGKLGNMTLIGDLDWNVWFGEFFAFGGEAFYRTDAANATGTDGRYFGGTLNLNYVFSDVWDGTLRYTYVGDKAAIAATAFPGGSFLNSSNTAATSAAKTQVHQFTLGGQYHIADGAKLQLEARYDILKNGTAGQGTGSVYGGSLAFLYNF